VGIQRFELHLTLTKDELISLLLDGVSVATNNTEGGQLDLRGCLDYQRYGDPATLRGSEHYFNTYITYKGQATRARVRLLSTRSSVKDTQYVGTISFQLSKGNLSE